MFAEQLSTEIAAASMQQLDHLAPLIWRGHAAGAITDDDAQRLAEQIAARRKLARAEHRPVGLPPGRASVFRPRRYQRSPDRQRSIERRRTLAASGPMPPRLASGFTTSELAVLRIVADEIRNNGGQCVITIPEIAARAGVCWRTAQNAIRGAAFVGLLTVQERRRSGQRNLANVIRIISGEWLSWLRLTTGCKKLRPTDTYLETKKEKGERKISKWKNPRLTTERLRC